MTVEFIVDLDKGCKFLSLSTTPDIPNIPDLGMSKYTESQQRSDPSQPRTRVLKDVLRTGRWKVGYNQDGTPRFWNVTPSTLQEIKTQYRLARERGVVSNLYWGQPSKGDQHNVTARDAISPIDDVFIDQSGERMWVTSYVTPEQARELKNPAHKVSVSVHENWEDGQGQSYPLMLVHTAVVDHPVVGDQKPFTVSLANSLQMLYGDNSRGSTNMAIDFATTKEQVNKLLPEGALLGDDVTEENFNERLGDRIQILEQLSSEGEDDSSDEDDSSSSDQIPGGGVEDVTGENQIPTEMNNQNQSSDKTPAWAMSLVSTVKELKDQVTELQNDKASSGRAAFEAKLKNLGRNGLPGKVIQDKMGLGQKYGWDMAILDGLENHQAVDMSNISGQHATGNAPEVPGNGRMTDDQVREILAEKGINPADAPRFHAN